MWSKLIAITLVLAASQVKAQQPLPPCKEADTISNMNIMIQIISFCDNGTDLEYLQATADKLASCSVQVTPAIMFKLMEFISKINLQNMSCISTDEINKILKTVLCKYVGTFIDQNAATLINNIKSGLAGILNGVKGALPNIKGILSFFNAPPPDAPNVKYSPNMPAMPTPAAPTPDLKSGTAPIPPPPPPVTPPPTTTTTTTAKPQGPFNPFGWLGR